MSRRSPAQTDVLELFKLLDLKTQDREINSFGPQPTLLPDAQQSSGEYRVILTNGTARQAAGSLYAELE